MYRGSPFSHDNGIYVDRVNVTDRDSTRPTGVIESTYANALSDNVPR